MASPSSRKEASASRPILSQIDDEAEDSGSENEGSQTASSQGSPQLRRVSTTVANKLRGSKSIAKRGDDARVLAKRLAAQRSQAPLRMPKTKLAQGSPGSYVDWRNKRAGKPKAQQLIQNLEALTGLFTHIEEHCKSLDETLPDRAGRTSRTMFASRSVSSARGRSDDGDDMADKKDNEEADEVASGFESDETEPRYTAVREDDDGTFELTMESARDAPCGRSVTMDFTRVLCQLTLESARDTQRGRSVELKGITESMGDKPDDGFLKEVKIARVPSPQRTEKSRSWRPPTPFPRMDNEAEYHAKAESIKNGESLLCRVSTWPFFDFCGFGNWRYSLKEPLTVSPRGTVSSRGTERLISKGTRRSMAHTSCDSAAPVRSDSKLR